MFSFLSSMKIDEARVYVLSKYSKVRGQTIVTEFDHNPISIIGQFNCLWNSKPVQESQRYEMFNFKDPEGITKFNELTSSDTLIRCLTDSDVKHCGEKWEKTFKDNLHRSFKKI